MSDAIVARQPIFDDRQKLVGFELLYRHSGDSTSAHGATSTVMASSTVVQAVLGIGLDRLTEGERVWINLSRDLIVERAWELLDPKAVVLEILETVEPDADVIAACADAKKRGYTLALDDFVWDEKWVPLLDLASMVKVDVQGRTVDELKPLVAKLKTFNVKLLAERVETDTVRAACAAIGFTLFQGYFYCQPETVIKRDLSAAEASALQLLNLVRNEKTPTNQVEQGIKRDPAMTFKLLRIVNSAAMGFTGIESIPHALRLLGRTQLERWLTLLVMASFAKGGARQRELFKLSLTRARLLELMSDAGDRDQRFLVGMFSMLHVLLQAPMKDVITSLQLSETVSQALLERTGPHGPLLAGLEAYEVGDWDRVELVTGSDDRALVQIAAHYPAALAWALEQVKTTG
jgi:EAL and modified HD-GYP domain-containing signal transduction protein